MEYCAGPAVIIAAFVLDLAVGESERLPHPVIWMGRIIAWAEGRFNRPDNAAWNKLTGILLAYLLPVGSLFATALVLKLAYVFGETLGFTASVLLAYTTLSARGLRDAAYRVKAALEREDLSAARAALSHIVGRDTTELDEPEIVRAAVETTAENTSDGVIAPLFYLFIGGVPLAMAYKSINTLDSMVGYRNDRYRDFGWASARLDDLANFIPARLTALAMVGAAFILKMDWENAWRIMRRDCLNHPSPNAGWPEAAAAGALGVRLGGLNRYPGRVEQRPFIGEPVMVLERAHIEGMVKLMCAAATLALAGLLLLRGIIT